MANIVMLERRKSLFAVSLHFSPPRNDMDALSLTHTIPLAAANDVVVAD